MQWDELVWEFQTNSISVILLLKEKYFMITKNKMIINIDRYIQITKKLFTLIMSSYEVQWNQII